MRQLQGSTGLEGRPAEAYCCLCAAADRLRINIYWLSAADFSCAYCFYRDAVFDVEFYLSLTRLMIFLQTAGDGNLNNEIYFSYW